MDLILPNPIVLVHYLGRSPGLFCARYKFIVLYYIVLYPPHIRLLSTSTDAPEVVSVVCVKR